MLLHLSLTGSDTQPGQNRWRAFSSHPCALISFHTSWIGRWFETMPRAQTPSIATNMTERRDNEAPEF